MGKTRIEVRCKNIPNKVCDILFKKFVMSISTSMGKVHPFFFFKCAPSRLLNDSGGW